MKTSMEFKVLSGVHAGARALLRGARTVIGCAADCDIVLMADGMAEHHAALVLRDDGRVEVDLLDGAVMAADGTSVPTSFLLPPCTPVGIGSCIVAVGPAGEAWPRIDLSTFGRAAAPPPAAPPAPAGTDGTPAPTTPVPPPVVVTAGRPQHQNAAAKSSPRLYPVAALLAVGIVFIGVSWFTGADGGSAATAEAAVSTPQPIEAAAAVLARLPYAAGVELRPVSDRVLLATGYVELSAQKETLRTELTLDGIEVVQRIWAMDELLAEAGTRAAQLVPGARVSAPAPGEIAVAGYVADEGVRARLLTSIREDVPGVRTVHDTMTNPDDLQQAVRDAVAASPLRDHVTLAAAGTGLTATGALDEGQMALWNDLVDGVTTASGVAPPVRADFVPRTDTLPFIVRSVVTGAHRYVVTGDGRRVSEGGSLADGYRLEAIGDGEITIRRNDLSFVQRFKE